VRSEIREALKNFNTNPFSTAAFHEDALNAEDEILMQISDQIKRVTLQDIGEYISLDSSNYTSNVNFNSSNYTNNVNFNSSNYTSRIEGELSDRIGYPFSIIPPRLTSGVYVPLKAQELQLTETNTVVGTHTAAILVLEGQIESMVVVGGIIGLITGGTLGGAINLANTANNKANLANDKVDNLIITTTQDKEDTSNYVRNTSNIISTTVNFNDFNSSNYVASTSNLISTTVNLYDDNSSNYVASTSNLISTTINLYDDNSSNYVASTSNLISTKVNLNDVNSSNYVEST